MSIHRDWILLQKTFPDKTRYLIHCVRHIVKKTTPLLKDLLMIVILQEGFSKFIVLKTVELYAKVTRKSIEPIFFPHDINRIIQCIQHQKYLVNTTSFVSFLNFIASPQHKLFFEYLQQQKKHSALLLSGGASLGFYHIGVVQSLLKNNLLPRIISGSSAGSLTTQFIGTHTDDEISDMFNNIQFRHDYLDLSMKDSIFNTQHFHEVIRSNSGDLTFLEAYYKTGRIINIVVTLESDHSIRHLNYKTSPHVLVWSAAAASCSIPLCFCPCKLWYKDCHGKIYCQDETYVDGSILADLPMQHLKKQFHIDHCIISQVNLLSICNFYSDNYCFKIVKNVFYAVLQEICLFYKKDYLFHAFEQPFEGGINDVTITPWLGRVDFLDVLISMFHNPTRDCLKKMICIAQEATDSKKSIIYSYTEIDLCLSHHMHKKNIFF